MLPVWARVKVTPLMSNVAEPSDGAVMSGTLMLGTLTAVPHPEKATSAANVMKIRARRGGCASVRGESGTAGTYRPPPRSAQHVGSGALGASARVPAAFLATVTAAALFWGAAAFLGLRGWGLGGLQHLASSPLGAPSLPASGTRKTRGLQGVRRASREG